MSPSMSHSLPTRIGLVLSAWLAAGDVALPVLSDGDFPPMVVVFVVAGLGVVTLAALVPAWRGSTVAQWIVVAARLLSALVALPALFVGGVPAIAVTTAAAWVVLTVAVVATLVPGLLARQQVAR